MFKFFQYDIAPIAERDYWSILVTLNITEWGSDGGGAKREVRLKVLCYSHA